MGFVFGEEVAKLKASIGAGIGILNTLLEVESLERGELMQKDIQRVIGQTERVLPAMDVMARSLQSSLATKKQSHDLQHSLEQLTNSLRPVATTHQAQTLINASEDLSTQIESTATKHQAGNLAKLMENFRLEQNNERTTLLSLSRGSVDELRELRKLTRDSNLMLLSLVKPQPAGSGNLARPDQDTTQLQLSPSDNSSQNTLVFDITHIKNLLEALRRGLNAIILMFLWLSPAFQICRRTLATISRPPTMLLDSNIILVDAFNREFSLQYQQFRYWSVVSAWLECQFRDSPGLLRVTHRKFAISRNMRLTGRGSMITSTEWESSVLPGQRVLMSMDVGDHVAGQQKVPLHNACPFCGYSQRGLAACYVWVKW